MMPGNLLAADTGLPDLNGKGSTEEKLKAVSGYLYMLLEQLRYTLSNLGQDNFNDTELEILGKTLTAPVEIRLKDAEGNMAELSLKADELSGRVENVQKDMTTVTQTAKELTVKIETAQGKITTITQNVDGLGIHDDGGHSSLSGIALLFYDGAGYKVPGSLGFEPGKGNIIGRVRVDHDGDGTESDATHRLFVGTGKGHAFNGIGYDEVNYSLKLQSYGDGSLTSEEGNVWVMAAGQANLIGTTSVMVRCGRAGSLSINNEGVVSISRNGDIYTFTNDGILHNGTKCSQSDSAVKKLVDAQLKQHRLI